MFFTSINLLKDIEHVVGKALCQSIILSYTKYSVNDSRRLVCAGDSVILSRKSEQSDPVEAL